MKTTMKLFSKRNVLLASVVFFVSFVAYCAKSVHDSKEFFRPIILNQIRYNNLRRFDEVPEILPEDVVDSSGDPILSWRVVYALAVNRETDEWNPEPPLNLSKPWYDDGNLKAAKNKPYYFFFPFSSPGELQKGRKETTCVVRIKEVHERIKQSELTEQEKKKAYLVLLDKDDSFCWTRPYDVSWKDLASGKVKLINDPIIYMNAEGEVQSLEETPQTPEEWQDFCGFDDLAAED